MHGQETRVPTQLKHAHFDVSWVVVTVQKAHQAAFHAGFYRIQPCFLRHVLEKKGGGVCLMGECDIYLEDQNCFRV